MPEAKRTERDYRWFPEGFWKLPGKEEARVGDRRKERIYLAVGKSLSTWEQVEGLLVELYHIFCHTLYASAEIKTAVARTYGSIESSVGRLKTMRFAAEAYFGHRWTQKDVQWTFNQLNDSIRRASEIRINIAHGIVISPRIERPNQNGPPTIETFGSFLIASPHFSPRNDLFKEFDPTKMPTFITSRYVYISSDIMEFVKNLTNLKWHYANIALEFRSKALTSPRNITE